MPNLSKTKKRLELYKIAYGSLKNGKAIEVENRLLLPSLKDGDSDGDLATVERMLGFLGKRCESASVQELRKGINVDGDLVGMAPGAPRLVSEFGLTNEDLSKIIPTGSNGISKRDVRVFARYKENNDLEKYYRKNLARKGVSEQDIEEQVKKLLSSPVVKEVKEKPQQVIKTKVTAKSKPANSVAKSKSKAKTTAKSKPANSVAKKTVNPLAK